jgi:nucleoside-diphosphate-sugar epimerase
VHLSVRRFLPHATAEDLDRLHVVSADLGDPGALVELPLASISHVLHLAVDGGSSARAQAANLDGTTMLAQLAARTTHFQRFLYVGSAWSCGQVATSGRVLREDDYPGASYAAVPGLPAYLADKMEVEQQLERLTGLPYVVARPSLVSGHSTLGCLPGASLFWIFRLLDRVGHIPWPDNQRVDMVPVDWLAAALVRLLLAPTLLHRTYHLSAGALASVTWKQIEEAFAQATGIARHYRYSTALTPTRAWPDCSAPVSAEGPSSPTRLIRWELLQRCIAFLSVGALFDNSRALGLGIPAPMPMTSYLPRCLSFSGGRTIEAQALDDL